MIEHAREGNVHVVTRGDDAKAPEDGLVAAALDIVRPLADKDRDIYRSLKRTLRADLGRAFGFDL